MNLRIYHQIKSISNRMISSACAFSVFISPTQRMGSRAFSSSVTPAASIIRGSMASMRSRAALVKADGDKLPPPALFLPLCGGQVIGPRPADAPASSARAGCCPTRGGGQRLRFGRSPPPSCPDRTERRYAGPGWRSAASAQRTLPPAAASAPGFPPG